MTQILWIWLQLGTCAALIAVAGTMLSRYGDVISEKTGLSGSWIGLVMLATVTSLPELITGISSVTAVDEPDIAVGNILGSCVFNLVILVIMDFFYRNESVYRRASHGHILSAAFGIVLIGFSTQSILLGNKFSPFSLGHLGLYSPFIVLLYFIAMRSVFFYERAHVAEFVEQTCERYPYLTLRQAIARYVGAASCVVGAGIWLSFLGPKLADEMEWRRSFVGTLFVASITSLPELVVTIGAMRIGAIDMAIANLLGSNLFNILILAACDLFYMKGPILFVASPVHAISGISAAMMSGMVIIGLLYRPGTRLYRTVSWVSLGLFCIYILNTTILYLHGE